MLAVVPWDLSVDQDYLHVAQVIECTCPNMHSEDGLHGLVSPRLCKSHWELRDRTGLGHSDVLLSLTVFLPTPLVPGRC